MKYKPILHWLALTLVDPVCKPPQLGVAVAMPTVFRRGRR